jgi:16S rRNA (guanine966-N2)-methyltransferase
VIAGSAKGVPLGPVPRGVRPVSDRAREGIFSSLGEAVRGARVLDLFAGTGAMAIEALSRGADRATLVERDRAALRAIADNLERTRLGDRASVRAVDVSRFVRDRGGAFDLLFVDPPYDLGSEELSALLDGVLGSLAAREATAVVTRRKQSSMHVIPVHWAVARRLDYGDTVVLILRRDRSRR